MYNLFYEEPDPDRWFKYDRYFRKIIRKLLRGPEPIGGVQRWFLNLRTGLDILGVPYTINDYKALKKNPESWALVVGRSHVIEKIPNHTKIIYGPSIEAHPFENDFWIRKRNIKQLIISCAWFKQMYDEGLPIAIPSTVWPSGIEVDEWKPITTKHHQNKILIYDKIRWEWDSYNQELITPIKNRLTKEGIDIEYIRYGDYEENEFKELLKKVDGMIFLCEHETQGFAYLQTLSSGVPIFAWDRGGYWQDPSLFPHRVKFKPVTSVPYWDERCGEKFYDIHSFDTLFSGFWENIKNSKYNPRQFVLENFKLEDCAQKYIDIVNEIKLNESTIPLR